ncbi:MAG: hypothetical protein QMB37_01600 [Paludibacteraceae bacterium]
MKKTIILPVLSILMLFVAGCTNEDYHLNKSVFIEDITNPGLPEYSEWGYNTFGAYIDRVPFVSDMVSLPSKIIVNPDTFNLILNGKINDSEPAVLKFRLIGFAPSTYPDLILLNGKTFNLKQDSCLVEYTESEKTTTLKIISGELKFIRAQKLFVDKELTKTILSGTFIIQTFRNNEPITFSSGRFDLGFGHDNFYNF